MEAHENATLTEQEVIETFVSVLSEVYSLKQQWVNQIPAITYVTKKQRLKMLLVESGTLLQTEMLRMGMALKTLKRVLPTETPIADEIKFEKFLFKDITGISIYDDMKLINHLMLIVSMEVNSFRSLDILSKSLRPKSVNRLMRENLNGAIKQKQEILIIFKSYLKSTDK